MMVVVIFKGSLDHLFLNEASPNRSIHPDVFCEKGVLKEFAKFTGKHLCQRLFFNKVAGLRPATLLNKTLTQVFSCECCEILKNNFFYRTPPVTACVQTAFKTNFTIYRKQLNWFLYNDQIWFEWVKQKFQRII